MFIRFDDILDWCECVRLLSEAKSYYRQTQLEFQDQLDLVRVDHIENLYPAQNTEDEVSDRLYSYYLLLLTPLKVPVTRVEQATQTGQIE